MLTSGLQSFLLSISYNVHVMSIRLKTEKSQFCGGNTHSPLNRPKPAMLSISLCLNPDNLTRQWGTPGVDGLITH